MRRLEQQQRVRPFGFVLAGALVVGGCLCILLGFWRPLAKVRQARSWQPTTCTIARADLKTTYDGDGDEVYHLDVAYRYHAGETMYRGNRYGFFDSYIGRKSTILRITDQLRPGRGVPCFYDPADPTRSVIRRDWNRMSILALSAIALIILGIAVFLHFARRRRQALDGLPGIERWRRAQTADGRITLQPRGSRLWRIALPLTLTSIAVPLAAGLWYVLPQDLAVVRFVTRGLLAAGALATTSWLAFVLLESVGPRIRLTLPTLQLRPGDTIDIDWAARTISPTIRTLRFSLEGREVAISATQGAPGISRSTKTNTFHSEELRTLSGPKSLRHRKIQLTIPSEALPSFDSEHNRVYWVVRVQADVAFWPDVDEEFELIVLPAAGV